MKRIFLCVVLALVSVSITSNAYPAVTVKVEGSSTVYAINEAVAEEFQGAEKGKTRVTVGISGTGGGFKKLCNSETDIADASRPIKPSEVELCKKKGIEYIELPVAYDGLAIMVNPKNNWVDHMTVKELKKLWEPEAQKKIKKWNQIRPNWPNKEIHLFGAGVDSGTYDYFTEAIVGKAQSSRGDFTASEDDNVLVQGIANDQLGLGFFGLAYYEHNKDRLKRVGIDDENPKNGDGPIVPSAETVMDGTYQPLARPIFIYVSTKAANRPEVKEFVRFYLTAGRPLVREVGYIALPDKAYDLALRRFAQRTVGSVFGGKGAQVGITLDVLLAAEAR